MGASNEHIIKELIKLFERRSIYYDSEGLDIRLHLKRMHEVEGLISAEEKQYIQDNLHSILECRHT